HQTDRWNLRGNVPPLSGRGPGRRRNRAPHSDPCLTFRKPEGVKMENTLGLAMTGGGARGAYQAGVLKRIGEIKRVQTHGNPFPIIGGASAGAINGAGLAMGCDDFSLATKAIAQLWSSLRPSDVFHCDV